MKHIVVMCMFAAAVMGQECWEPHTPGEYPSGKKVSRLNRNYQANWTTRETPGAENWGGWKDYGTCTNGSTPSNSCWTAYKTGMYKTGSEVSFLKKNYRANWTTTETPGVQNWGGWTMIDECSDNTASLSYIALSDTIIEEGSGDNAVVGYLSASLSDVAAYRLVSGTGDADNALFSIQNNILRVQHSLKSSEKAARSIRIEGLAANGTKYARQFTIVVKPVSGADLITNSPITPASISQFALYSHDDMNINSSTNITGMIGSNSNIAMGDLLGVGWQTNINGDIWVNGKVVTNSEAVLAGNIYAPAGIELGWAGRHAGALDRTTAVPYFQIPAKVIPVSDMNAAGEWQEKKVLTPGTYGDISICDGGSLTLTSGVYNCKSLSLNSNSIKIFIDVKPGETVELNVENALTLGSAAEIVFLQNYAPASLKIHTNQFSPLILPDHGKISGTIIAPNTTVVLNSGCTLYGAVYAKKIDILDNVTVIRPPYLTDIWHSEWAYAPPFDLNQMKYTGIVPNGALDHELTAEYAVLYPNLSVTVTKTQAAAGPKYIFKVLDPATSLTSYYSLDLMKDFNSVIYVNDDAVGANTGSSWANAYKNLQDAINDAAKSGKEIWLAEGTYTPSIPQNSVDPRSKTFLLPQGIEILGGFAGNETIRRPEGSPYSTILSGDIQKNDGNEFPAVPFCETDYAKVKENAYHVVTISGINRARSTRLKGVTISNGIADGVGDNQFGGGVFSKYAYPAVEECIVKNNYAVSNGAGIYAGGGIQSFSKALFENNTTLSGHGAGIYLNSCTGVQVSQAVFSGNRALGVGGKSAGGAIFANGAELSFVNTVFYKNSAKFTGGTIYGNSAKLNFTHVTSTENSSADGVGGIVLSKCRANIVNSILWNNDGELSGDTVQVTYSCINGGHAGEGNISADPKFVDAVYPDGDDGWGDMNDGLRLKPESPCLDVVDTIQGIDYDMIENLRPLGSRADMGAYETAVLLNGDSNVDIGYITFDNEFINSGTQTLLLQDVSQKDLIKKIYSRAATTVRILAPKNRDTQRIKGRTAYGDISFGDGPSIRVTFYPHGETASHFVYTSRKFENGTFIGKPIFLVTSSALVGTDDFYVLRANLTGKIKISVPAAQFF